MPKKFIKRPMGVMMARNRKIKDGIITVSPNLKCAMHLLM